MESQFDEGVKPYRNFLTKETSTYIQQMPLLISGKNLEGNIVDVPREPIEVWQVFERRLNSSNLEWMNNYFDTGTGLLIPTNGSYGERRFKIRIIV